MLENIPTAGRHPCRWLGQPVYLACIVAVIMDLGHFVPGRSRLGFC